MLCLSSLECAISSFTITITLVDPRHTQDNNKGAVTSARHWCRLVLTPHAQSPSLLHLKNFFEFLVLRNSFIHVVRGCTSGLLQFSRGEAVKIFLAFVLSGIRTVWPNRERSCTRTMAESFRSEVYCVRVCGVNRNWRIHEAAALEDQPASTTWHSSAAVATITTSGRSLAAVGGATVMCCRTWWNVRTIQTRSMPTTVRSPAPFA